MDCFLTKDDEEKEAQFLSLCAAYNLTFVRKAYIPLIRYIVSGEPFAILELTKKNCDVVKRFSRFDFDIVLKEVPDTVVDNHEKKDATSL